MGIQKREYNRRDLEKRKKKDREEKKRTEKSSRFGGDFQRIKPNLRAEHAAKERERGELRLATHCFHNSQNKNTMSVRKTPFVCSKPLKLLQVFLIAMIKVEIKKYEHRYLSRKCIL